MRESGFDRRFQFARPFACQVPLKEVSGHDKPQPKGDERCARPCERPFESLAVVTPDDCEQAWNLDEREKSGHSQTSDFGNEREDLPACGRTYDGTLFCHSIPTPKLRSSAPAFRGANVRWQCAEPIHGAVSAIFIEGRL